MSAARLRVAATRRLGGRGLPGVARRDSAWVVVRFFSHLEDPCQRRRTRLPAGAYVHLRRAGHAERRG